MNFGFTKEKNPQIGEVYLMKFEGENNEQSGWRPGLVFQNNNIDLQPGTFRVKGDVVEIALGSTDEFVYRISFYGDEVEDITKMNPLTGEVLSKETYKTQVF